MLSIYNFRLSCQYGRCQCYGWCSTVAMGADSTRRQSWCSASRRCDTSRIARRGAHSHRWFDATSNTRTGTGCAGTGLRIHPSWRSGSCRSCSGRWDFDSGAAATVGTWPCYHCDYTTPTTCRSTAATAASSTSPCKQVQATRWYLPRHTSLLRGQAAMGAHRQV